MSQMEDGPLLQSASKGFDCLFNNEIEEAKQIFGSEPDSPAHLTGMGVCSFLEAALGMETAKMAEAAKCLTAAEAGSKKQQKASQKLKATHRFPAGTEWEILNTDATVLLGITHALGESYMGYLQCMYALNSAHSKFTRLFKTVFPAGMDGYHTPADTPSSSAHVTPRPSQPNLKAAASSSAPSRLGLFGRLTGSAQPSPITSPIQPEGPVEELIVAGTAFGYGLFNLIFSLLPKRVQSVVGLFGYKSSRKVALQALAVAAAMNDIHSVFAGLVLMSYHGLVLLLSGWQADEEHILKQYRAIAKGTEDKFPTGALWLLNRAKIRRMEGDADGAILILRQALDSEHKIFAQADTLLYFELAWTLLAERHYIEAGESFMRLTELNNWSHTTYYFLSAGCYFSAGNRAKAQEILDAIPGLLEKKRIAGAKQLPTEVLVAKKLDFYKAKHARRGGDPSKFIESIKISPAEEMALFWNVHTRITTKSAKAHISDWSSLTPSPSAKTTLITTEPVPVPELCDLDSGDELALRSLLIGIVHRTIHDYAASRIYLEEANRLQKEGKVEVSTWISGVSLFELAVAELRGYEHSLKSQEKDVQEAKAGWGSVLKLAESKLDEAMIASPNSVDLSTRLDSRVMMLREEINTKREMLGLL